VKSVRVKNYRFSAPERFNHHKTTGRRKPNHPSPSAKAKIPKRDDFLYTQTYTMDEKGESVEEMYQRNEYIAVKKSAG